MPLRYRYYQHLQGKEMTPDPVLVDDGLSVDEVNTLPERGREMF